MGMGYCQGQRATSQSIEIIVPAVAETPMRRCYVCDEWYPATLEFFHSDMGRVDEHVKLASSCKECNNNARVARHKRAKLRGNKVCNNKGA